MLKDIEARVRKELALTGDAIEKSEPNGAAANDSEQS
jgi:hypothetical protein